jgi:DNA-directed RNA polymerase subunit alpha
MVYDEEREKRKDRQNKILETPISDFELSVRSRNCLKKMNIATLGDLLRTTEAELLAYKNFGETSLMEIKKILDSRALRLGMAVEQKSAITVASSEPEEQNGVNPELLTKPVDDLELSVRARRALGKLNVKTFYDLVTKTEAELLGCKNFGVTSLNEIKEKLTNFGLTLRKLD